ncbi:MAG: hypothetical protein V4850_24935 [Myxococcota bacterium]
MHPFDALAELGLARDADGSAVRAAYLRLLRERRPETDPDGFMRLRAAYEAVRHRPVRPAAAPLPIAPAAPPEIGLAAPTAAPPEIERAAPAATAAPPEIERAAPTPPAAPPKHEDVAPAAAAAAVEPAKNEPPAPTTPAPAKPPEPEPDRELTDPTLTAWEHAAATGGDPPTVPFAALYFALALYEAGDVTSARRLGGALDRWLHVHLNETRHFHEGNAFTLRYLRQLLLLPADYPVAQLRLIAAAIREGNPAAAEWDLRDVLEIRPKEESHRARALLSEHAPLLSAAVFQVGEPVAQVRTHEASGPSFQWVMLIFVGIGLLGKLAGSIDDRPATVYPRVYPDKSLAPLDPRAAALKQARIELTTSDTAVQTAAAAATMAAMQEDCVGANNAILALDYALAGAADGALAGAADAGVEADPAVPARAATFRAAIAAFCPTPAPPQPTISSN